MKLYEMPKLPETAGLARLSFDVVDSRPRRYESEIFLPENPGAEFFQLQKGRQFLFMTWTRTWFGGTDENPFLVELDNEVLDIFRREGEKGFYDALKPEVITAVEKRYNVVSKRQGDIWAAPLPSWDDVNFALLLCDGHTVKPITRKSIPIFGTRHKLTGRCVDSLATIFTEGTIEAPDHSPMKLRGVHVLAQTRHLADPAMAD